MMAAAGEDPAIAAALVRMLLAHGGAAEIHYARPEDKLTALHVAGMSGNLAAAQVLIVYGASIEAEEQFGDTVATLAVAEDQPHVGMWLAAVAGWSPLRIAMGCRLHNDARTALRLGLIDPDLLLIAEIRASKAAARASPANLGWPNAPRVCPATLKVAIASVKGWGPAQHWLHHSGVRTAVYAVLVVAERLEGQGPPKGAEPGAAEAAGVRVAAGVSGPAGGLEVAVDGAVGIAVESSRGQGSVAPATDSRPKAQRNAASPVLPVLPPGMWAAIMSFFLRSDWPVLAPHAAP